MRNVFEKILERLLRCPTAPFYEGYVLREILELSNEYGLRVKRDGLGNVRAALPGATSRGAPLFLVAHTDHPGFAVTGSNGKKAQATWWGGVRPPYFRGSRVRLFPYEPSLNPAAATKASVRGTVRRMQLDRRKVRVTKIEIALEKPLDPSSTWIGSWDLPAFSKQKKFVASARIDDLAGCALALATLIGLKDRLPSAPVVALFTRAEEDGFHGALASARSGLVPRKSLCLSLETSAVRPGIRQGAGPVVRLGDAAGVFDSQAVRWVEETAAALKGKKHFAYQKRIMDGGTCEATAFAALGFSSAGIALPLRGYHNMGSSGKVAAEKIHMDDAHGALELLEALAYDWQGKLPVPTMLAERMEERLRGANRLLHRRPVPGSFFE